MIDVYFDGASAGNPGPSGAGIFIKKHGEVERFSLPLGELDNHEAEFHAFIAALKLCIEKGYKSVSFRTDSQLVSRAVEKEYVKNKRFAPLLQEALALVKQMDMFFILWVPSSENKTADELSKAAIIKQAKKQER
ncbi:reverse transcriptase-like protein [Paenibacillus silvisoli]|uniref:reverse transcriptase-like protein n=1 Tax=Paenibacillus silvisoli TaxID=3110539 RepID=UPI00280399EB|nr:reverse transcriptase-like protein [Paenibacillus silvisoli]